MFQVPDRAGWLTWLSVFGVWCLIAILPACTCDPPDPDKIKKDGGTKEITSLAFIRPKADSIISGQITIEVEVKHPEGVNFVEFLVNGAPLKQVDKPAATSTPDSPRYSAQVATTFLPRGVISLTARVNLRGKNPPKLEKTIQVRSRELWAAAFGVGQVRQIFLRSDQHLYIRLFRSEEDLSRITNPGPRDRVGTTITTTNNAGTLSWGYLGISEDFGPLVIDSGANIYFYSRHLENGTNRLVSIGRGEDSWGPAVEVKPRWYVPLGGLSGKGTPLLDGQGYMWVHLTAKRKEKTPGHDSILRVETGTGKATWRYKGKDGDLFEIVRGPFLANNGEVIFVRRKAESSDPGISVELLKADGTSKWRKDFKDVYVSQAVLSTDKKNLILAVERRVKGQTQSSAVRSLSVADGSENWKREWPNSSVGRMLTSDPNIVLLRQFNDGSQQATMLQNTDGKPIWAKPLVNRQVTAMTPSVRGGIFLVSGEIDSDRDPVQLIVERFDGAGKELWSYKNKVYFPGTITTFSKDSQETFWLLARELNDKRLLLGSRLICLDKGGKRRYLFSDEARRFLGMAFFAPNALFLSSIDSRDGRVHKLLAR